MVSFKVAIPSYNRARPLLDYTLSTILSKNIDPSCIDIFISDEDEYSTYKKTIPADMYNELIISHKLKSDKMNFIRRYYKKGQKLLNLDDDISEIYQLYNEQNVPLNDLAGYSEYIFKNMKKYKMGLCGILRSKSANHKKHSLSLNYYDVDGYLYWTINNPTKKLDVYMPYCVDAEFCVKNFDYYGMVMKSNEISIVNESKSKKNDLIRLAYDREKGNARIKLIAEYPKYAKLYPKYRTKEYTYPLKFQLKPNTISIPTVVKKW